MWSAASAMSVFGSTVSRSVDMRSETVVAFGSPPSATRLTRSRSVTMPARVSPSMTMTEEIPCSRSTVATCSNVSEGEVVFTSVCMMSRTCIAVTSDRGRQPNACPFGAASDSERGGAPSVVRTPAEVERGDLERGDAAGREEELARELGLPPDHLGAGQRLQDRLGEPEVLDGVRDPAVPDQERPVARHPGDRRLDRVDDVRVVEPRHEQPTLGRRDHLVDLGLTRRHEQVQGERTLGVRGGQGVAGRRGARLLGRAEVVDGGAEHPILDQVDTRPWYALEVE